MTYGGPFANLLPILEDIASPSPSPGGGSAAAIAGGLAHACLSKALALSKDIDDKSRNGLLNRMGHAKYWLVMADQDAERFGKYAETWKKKVSDSDKAALADGVVETCLSMARHAGDLLIVASFLNAQGNPKLMPDIVLGTELSWLVLTTVIHNASSLPGISKKTLQEFADLKRDAEFTYGIIKR